MASPNFTFLDHFRFDQISKREMAVSKLAARLGRKVLPLESTSGPISFPIEGSNALSSKAYTSVTSSTSDLSPKMINPEITTSKTKIICCWVTILTPRYHPQPQPGPKPWDFDFLFSTQVLTPKVQEPERRQRRGVVGPYGPPPLTLLFGWAGSNEKNLAKYSNIYLNQVWSHLILASKSWQNNFSNGQHAGLHHRPDDPPHQPHLQGDGGGDLEF